MTSTSQQDPKAELTQQVCDVIARITQDGLHTASEIASYAGVDVSAVYRWTGKGVTPGLGEFLSLANNSPSEQVRTMLRALLPAPTKTPQSGDEFTGNAEEHLTPSAINLAEGVGKLLRYAAAADGVQAAASPSERDDRRAMLRLVSQELLAIEQIAQHVLQCCVAQNQEINSRRAARPLRLTDET